MEQGSYGAALQYFTGSKDHNIRMRDLAISKGWKLNEYGLYDGDKRVAGEEEEDVYNRLGISWIPPELRENMGEIEAARNGSLPDIMKIEDIKGDLHSHTNESDGANTLEEMVERASSIGHRYLAVTDHSVSLKVANGLDEERFRKRNREIDRLNDALDGMQILKGVELEIRKDGSLDLPNQLLGEMDVVIIALHQWITDDISANTERVISAIESGYAFTLAHPTGRMIGVREAYKLDFDRIFQACKDNGVAVEINGFPERSDLPYDLVKRSRDFGLKYTIGSDSHRKDHLRFINYAGYIARRGWLVKGDVLNTKDFEKIRKR